MDRDTISRQDIIQRLEYVIAHGVPNERGVHAITAEAMLEAVKQLPPAQPEPYTDALKAEIKRMKRSFTICINSDYYTGYMSALSAVEGYIAQMEVTT